MDSRPGASGVPSALAALALVAVTVLAAHFTRLGQLGLYEDDYWSVAPHLGEPLRGLWSLALHQFTHWPQGRPLNHLLPPVLGAIGSKWGGLTGVYVLAAAWLTLNGLLVYLVSRRLTSNSGALVAAMAYLLFPADATKLLLTHAAHVQGAMTFLLLGCWLWLIGGWRRALSYPVASLCLLAYEPTFLPFLAIPLLVPLERSKRLQTWVTHLGTIALLVGLDVWLRLAMGETRVLAAAGQFGESVRRMVTSLWIGPATSLTMLFRAVEVGSRALDPLAVLAAAVWVLTMLAVLRSASHGGQAVDGEQPAPGSDAGRLPRWRLLLAALVIWSFAYAFTLTNYPPVQVTGRLSSTHVAAGWPVALALGVVFDMLSGAILWRRRLVVAVTVAWLAALVTYQHVLQRGYVRAWDEERRFWKQIMQQTPDVGPGWSVVVTGPPRAANEVILSNSWSDHLVHLQIHSLGSGEAGVTFAHLGYLGSQVAFERDEESWRWRPEFWGGPMFSINRARLALFEDDHGTLHRVEAVQTPSGLLRTAAPLPTQWRTSWPDTPVGRLLFPEEFPLK